MTKLRPGDRVRIRKSAQVFTVAEVDVPVDYLQPPSTYAVRLDTPPSAHPHPVLHGDAWLERVT